MADDATTISDNLKNAPVPVVVLIDADNPQGKYIKVDATMSEDHTFSAEVSSYPIENGSDITDNVRLKPFTLKLDCIITDTPLSGPTDNIPTADAYLALQKLMNAKKQVTVQTSLDTFINMVITDISIPRSATNGQSLVFTISFQQVIIIENQRTTVSAPAPRGGTTKNSNKQPVFSVVHANGFAQLSASFQFILRDQSGPDGKVGFNTWDHYSVQILSTVGAAGAATNLLGGILRIDANQGLGPGFVNGQRTGTADGYVQSGVYHSIRHPDTDAIAANTVATERTIYGSQLNAHYDAPSGLWIDDKSGAPITSDPTSATKYAAQQSAAGKPLPTGASAFDRVAGDDD